MGFMRKLRSAFREFGAFSGTLYLLDQAFARTGSRFGIFDYELMVQPVAEQSKAPANLTRAFEVREIPEGDELHAATPPPEQVIQARYAQPCVCLGAFQKGSFIGYQWLCFGPYEEDEVRCTFVPHPADESVFDFDFYLFPEYRLGLGFVALWDGANRYLRERGIRYTTSRVSRFNTASRKSHQHFGWRCVGRAVFLAGKRWQLMLANVAPYVHLSLSPESRPRVIIAAGAD